MDAVAKQLADTMWPYASQDLQALAAIERRVANVGRERGLLTYTEVVSGISFRLPTVEHGRPIQLGVPDWSDLHRAIVGDFLGRMCLDTYVRGGFMGSALVVSSSDRMPSEGFRNLMRHLGLLHGHGEPEFLAFWTREVSKAHAWYGEHDW
jgi:hypothetical protein